MTIGLGEEEAQRTTGSADMKLLQVNTNRSRPAHDLALATANDIGADIILVSEPNVKAVQGRKDWVYDRQLDAAIKVLNPSTVVSGRGQGNGFCCINTPSFEVYSVYASGNRDIHELEETLNEIEQRMRSGSGVAVIAGDFNAKSPQWGETSTDNRGRMMSEWIANNDLSILNKPNEPTFKRRDYTSTLDLTLCTNAIQRRTIHWGVSEKETLSDHNYIIFEIGEQRAPQTRDKRAIGWQIKKKWMNRGYIKP